MPGVLIIEAMAQVGGMLLMGAVPDPDKKVVYFMSLNNVKWRKPVKPGDQLRFELELSRSAGMMCKMQGVAKVDGEVVARGGDGARWCATDERRASTRRRSSSTERADRRRRRDRRVRDRRRWLRDRRRLRDRAARDARAQRHARART